MDRERDDLARPEGDDAVLLDVEVREDEGPVVVEVVEVHQLGPVEHREAVEGRSDHVPDAVVVLRPVRPRHIVRPVEAEEERVVLVPVGRRLEVREPDVLRRGLLLLGLDLLELVLAELEVVLRVVFLADEGLLDGEEVV
eukprot:XP_001707492.1 Hypothetical protein GL50803_15767 [Giardia lamblia ATCC 50803]